jgi:hypothetical protein
LEAYVCFEIYDFLGFQRQKHPWPLRRRKVVQFGLLSFYAWPISSLGWKIFGVLWQNDPRIGLEGRFGFFHGWQIDPDGCGEKQVRKT